MPEFIDIFSEEKMLIAPFKFSFITSAKAFFRFYVRLWRKMILSKHKKGNCVCHVYGHLVGLLNKEQKLLISVVCLHN